MSRKEIAVILTFTIVAIVIYKAHIGNLDESFRPNESEQTSQTSDYKEGEKIDTDGNGKPDFIVKNGRLVGSVSGKDFGEATFENVKQKTTSTVKPSSVTIKPVPLNLHPIYYPNFKNYINYDIDEFLSVNGCTLSSNRSHELPEYIKNKVRNIGDYLHDHYTYGAYKSYNGIGQDDDTVFDCDDFAGLMYRMGKQAGLDIYILDLPGHWANAIRYGNTLYTIEPQGIDVRYRDTTSFGPLSVKEYAKYATHIVVER